MPVKLFVGHVTINHTVVFCVKNCKKKHMEALDQTPENTLYGKMLLHVCSTVLKLSKVSVTPGRVCALITALSQDRSCDASQRFTL